LSWFHPVSGWAALQALQPKANRAQGKKGESTDGDDGAVPGSGPEAEAAAKQAQEAAIAKAVRVKWVSESGEGTGERDYAPGYAQLLEGDLIFGDPETDPDSHALRALLQDAQQINTLILLGDVAATVANTSKESA
jgi:hypothetical protein